MATNEQIRQVTDLLLQTNPAPLHQWMNESRAGTGAVLKFLSKAEQPVTAGKVADFIGVSAARMTVLLKKMTSQGLIIRQHDTEDARITLVSLSEKGKELVREKEAEICSHIGILIDRMGMDRIITFVTLSQEVLDVFAELCPYRE